MIPEIHPPTGMRDLPAGAFFLLSGKCAMFSRCIVLLLLVAVLPASGFAQQNPPAEPQNTNSAGTLAAPGVSGQTNTLTMPLPAIIGSPENSTAPANSGVAGALFPPDYSPAAPNSMMPSISSQRGGLYPASPVIPPNEPTGGIPTCLNVRYSYLCRR